MAYNHIAHVWSPNKTRICKAQMTAFSDQAGKLRNAAFADYAELHRWSIEKPSEFWDLVSTFCDIQFNKQPATVFKQGNGFNEARWFEEAELNFTENLLSHQIARNSSEKIAIRAFCEHQPERVLTFKDLARQVAAVQEFLSSSGVATGDRVAAILPNIPETVIAMLAAASLGAIWSSCSPDFGASAIVDRFKQIEPKVIFVTDGYYYGGKHFSCAEKNLSVIEALSSSLKGIVQVNFADQSASLTDNSVCFREIISSAVKEKPEFKPLPFNHPLYILFSSGTTGAPKCIVHGAGNTLLQHAKEHVLHTDITSEDCVFYFTTCGWMMWNWLVSALARGCSIALYDGSPMHPDPEYLFKIANESGITIFGTSAKYLSALEKAGVKPKQKFKLTQLKTILSTGSPLLDESFDYVYREIKSEVCLSSISGGTDIVSCFMLGNPTLPVYRGELQVAGLGMDVQVYDHEGQRIYEKPGELICATPFPSMPLYFWNDLNGKKYQSAYFENFPGVWSHGDWCQTTEHNGFIIYGRSDATLNPGGVRIGTAEIYRQVDKLEEVKESLAIGQKFNADERIILFVVLNDPSAKLDDKLVSRIKADLRSECSPRHVPAKIIAVPDLPRTRSGKTVEIAVRRIINGQQISNLSALANPEALKYFENLEELKN